MLLFFVCDDVCRGLDDSCHHIGINTAATEIQRKGRHGGGSWIDPSNTRNGRRHANQCADWHRSSTGDFLSYAGGAGGVKQVRKRGSSAPPRSSSQLVNSSLNSTMDDHMGGITSQWASKPLAEFMRQPEQPVATVSNRQPTGLSGYEPNVTQAQPSRRSLRGRSAIAQHKHYTHTNTNDQIFPPYDPFAE